MTIAHLAARSAAWSGHPVAIAREGLNVARAAIWSPKTALSLAGISLSFGGVVALHDLDLEVQRGEIRAIIGPNGAGKSSVINVISGVYRPDRGHVSIGANRFANVPTQRLARLGVARTFQNLALFKGLSVLDNVMTGAGLSQPVRLHRTDDRLWPGRARAGGCP